MRVTEASQQGDWSLMVTNGNGAEQLVDNLKTNTTNKIAGWSKKQVSETKPIGVKYHGGEEQRLVFTEDDCHFQKMTFTTVFGNTTAVVSAYKFFGEEPGIADNPSLFLSQSQHEYPCGQMSVKKKVL